MNLQATLTYIERVEAIPDDRVRGHAAPLCRAAFKTSKAKLDAFYKNGARPQTTASEATLRSSTTSSPRSAAARFLVRRKGCEKGSARLGQFEGEWAQDAGRSGLAWGKTIPIDVDQIEDQNALVFQQTVKKGVEGSPASRRSCRSRCDPNTRTRF
ncbi:MAG: hypothetical protein M5R36_26025 [Deltaproteobacteria bacterium]|nr:hypothetical protein [Deltaproteobacteria bacterium]